MAEETTPDDANLPVATDERHDLERRLARLRRVANLMDDQFELPIVKYRVGLDPIIGLIPGGGDWVTYFVSVYILLEAIAMKVPPRVLLRIGWTITLDLVMGYVPVAGDLADTVYKANRRSVELVLDHFGADYDRRKPERVALPSDALERRSDSALAGWAVGLLLIVALFAVAAVPVVVMWWFLNG